MQIRLERVSSDRLVLRRGYSFSGVLVTVAMAAVAGDADLNKLRDALNQVPQQVSCSLM